jgi:hypothetical protein
MIFNNLIDDQRCREIERRNGVLYKLVLQRDKEKYNG